MSEDGDFDLRHIQRLNILDKVGTCFLRNLFFKDIAIFIVMDVVPKLIQFSSGRFFEATTDERRMGEWTGGCW